jgi:hypothetical protein
MNAEERALRAIEITRSVLERALNDPPTLVAMMTDEVTTQGLELLVEEILEYLEKTKEEKTP